MKRQIMDATEQIGVAGYTGRVKVAVEGDAIVALVCSYFARCENEATTTIDNPVLGGVPACERCAAKVNQLS